MYEPLNKTTTPWYKWLNNGGIIKILELIQDFITISLCLGLFGFMTSDPAEVSSAWERASVDASVTRDVCVSITTFKLYPSYG